MADATKQALTDALHREQELLKEIATLRDEQHAQPHPDKQRLDYLENMRQPMQCVHIEYDEEHGLTITMGTGGLHRRLRAAIDGFITAHEQYKAGEVDKLLVELEADDEKAPASTANVIDAPPLDEPPLKFPNRPINPMGRFHIADDLASRGGYVVGTRECTDDSSPVDDFMERLYDIGHMFRNAVGRAVMMLGGKPLDHEIQRAAKSALQQFLREENIGAKVRAWFDEEERLIVEGDPTSDEKPTGLIQGNRIDTPREPNNKLDPRVAKRVHGEMLEETINNIDTVTWTPPPTTED